MAGRTEKPRRGLYGLSELGRAAVLLLGAENGEPVPRAHFQAELYYASRMLPGVEAAAGFEPRARGPHSEAAEGEIASMDRAGLVMLWDGPWKKIELTSEGRRAFESVARGREEEARNVADLKWLLNGLSGSEMLAFAYFPRYDAMPGIPEGTAVYRRIAGRRRKLAESMYRKGRVSLGRSAEIAGVPPDEFMRGMRRRRPAPTARRPAPRTGRPPSPRA